MTVLHDLMKNHALHARTLKSMASKDGLMDIDVIELLATDIRQARVAIKAIETMNDQAVDELQGRDAVKHWMPTRDLCTQFQDLTAETTISADRDNGVRVYNSSPEEITLQLRAVGPTNERRNGKAKRMIATSHLNADEVRQTIQALTDALAHMEGGR